MSDQPFKPSRSPLVPPHPARVAQARGAALGVAARAPHPAKVLRGAAIQPRLDAAHPPHAAKRWSLFGGRPAASNGARIAQRMQGNTTATGTFWVMEMSEKLSKEMKQDVQHLCGNSALSGIDFDHQEVTLGSVLHANTQAAHYVGQKTFFVLTHAGLGSAPWIGGLDLASFAKALVSKYGLQNLQGGTLCLLVCFVGQELAALATELKSCGVNNLTLYSPTDFMFISKGGIPHVYEGESKGTEAMNKLVAKYDVDWFSLCNEGFRPTGYGWACSIIDNGQVKAGSKFARWVLETFDPGEDEA